jgi:hypothetical protein
MGMFRNLILAAATALFAAAAPLAAHAAPTIWVKCDGIPGQGKAQAAQMAKILIPFQVAGLPEAPSFMPAAEGRPGVSACTEALAAESVAGPDAWRRRANLHRARALHLLEAGDLAGALTDIAAARTELSPHVADIEVARGAAAPLDLLEALIQMRMGHLAEGERLALAAAEARPFAPSVQLAAADLLGVDPAMTEGERRVLSRLLAIDPARADYVAARYKEADVAAGATPDALQALQSQRATALSLEYYRFEAATIDPLSTPSFGWKVEPLTYAKTSFTRMTGYEDRAIKGADPATTRAITFIDRAPCRSMAGVEELAVRRAADLAAAHHAKGFIITRFSTGRLASYVTVSGSRASRDFVAGFQTDLEVVFVDPDNLPPELAGQKDRVIRVEPVLADTAWAVR